MRMTFFFFTIYSALGICLCEREPNHLKNETVYPTCIWFAPKSRILGANMTLISKLLLISGQTILKAGFSVVCYYLHLVPNVSMLVWLTVRSQATMKVHK